MYKLCIQILAALRIRGGVILADVCAGAMLIFGIVGMSTVFGLIFRALGVG
jgi:hypothetical protein